MKNVIRAEWYKLCHDLLIWIVPVYYAAMGFYSAFYYHEIMDYRWGLELFVLPEVVWLQIAFAVVVVTGYAVSGDFSRHTIQNALTVGVNKKDYYFSRLLVQMEFTGAMFAISLLVHTVCRLVHPKGNADVAVEFLWGKLLIYMFVVLLLLWAYVAILNMLAYFIKKQVIVMAVGMGVIYAEAIIRQMARSNDWGVIRLLVDWLPSNVERKMFEHAVYDTIFTGEFLGYGICAVAVIVISSAVGYIRFCYGMDVE